MKKIINGKLFDTGTAKCLGLKNNMDNTTDFRYCSETLYINRNGVYFLLGEGGPLSKYAEHEGNRRSSGWSIIPLTENAARKWAEENLNADKYMNHFGIPEQAS